MDVDTIQPGEDFVEVIEKAVSSCEVLLAIIDPDWLDVTDNSGERRLDDPNDYVRIEIATALQRSIRTVPVLINEAVMPRTNDLPEVLQSMARRQATEVTHKKWTSDVEQLISSLEKVVEPYTKQRESPHVEPENYSGQSLSKKTSHVDLKQLSWNYDLVSTNWTSWTVRVFNDKNSHIIEYKIGAFDYLFVDGEKKETILGAKKRRTMRTKLIGSGYQIPIEVTARVNWAEKIVGLKIIVQGDVFQYGEQ